MLPKAQRLPLRHLSNFFDTAQKFQTRHLVIFCQQLSPSTISQGAVIVPKKVAAQAVVRNQTKRRLRAALAQVLPLTQNVGLVIYLKRRLSDEVQLPELVQEMKHSLEKLSF